MLCFHKHCKYMDMLLAYSTETLKFDFQLFICYIFFKAI